MAIDRDVVVAIAAATTGASMARSADLEGIVNIAADGSDDPTDVAPASGRAIAGVARTLATRHHRVLGADLFVSSTIPIGAGLSSSAAFEVAVALALADRSGITIPVREVAVVAQEAEHVALGVPCGIQDQLTSLTGRARLRGPHRLPHARRRGDPDPTVDRESSSSTPAWRARWKAVRGNSGGPTASQSRLHSGCRCCVTHAPNRSPTRRVAGTSSARSRASSNSPTRCEPASSTRSGP